MGLLFKLSLWKLRNAWRSTISNPRRLIPALLVALLILFQIGTAIFASEMHLDTSSELARILRTRLDAIDSVVFLILALLSAGIIDAGFGGGALTFSLGDIDYLFPAPISRRTILAVRLPAATARFVLMALVLVGLFRLFIAQPLMYGRAPMAGWPAWIAAILFVSAYVNVAVAIELVFGLGRAVWVRRAILAFVGAAVALVGYVCWTGRAAGVAALGHNRTLNLLFFPARLAADALMNPLHRHTSATPLLWLLALQLATLALLFSRNENYYETAATGSERAAVLRQAAREMNWGAVWGGRAATAKDRSHAYSLPLFGRGAGALFWAHMAAAAKRPFMNFLTPLLSGVALVAALIAALPSVTTRGVVPIVGVATAYYIFYAVVMLGVPFFRRALQRYALIRPLPLASWQVVLADATPRVLMSSLFGWGSGLTLLWVQVPHGTLLALMLLVCLPMIIADLNLVQYLLAMWYPNPQDKIQTLVATFVQLLLTGVLIGGISAFWVMALAAGASTFVTVAIVLLGSTGAAGVLFAWTTYVFERYQPSGDTV